MDAMFWLLVVMCLGFNLLATRKVWRDRDAAKLARAAKILTVWLVPVLGVIVVLVWSDWPRPQPARVRVVSVERGSRSFGSAGAGGAAAFWMHIEAAAERGGFGGGSSYSSDAGGSGHGGDGSSCHGGDGGGGDCGGDCGGGGGGGDGGGGGSCH